MKYTLQPLLMVRKFREDEAANAVVSQRRQVASAEQSLAHQRRALEDYTAWRARKEVELWEDVLSREVRVRDIDDLKLDLQIVWRGQVERQELVFAGEKQLAEEENKLADAVAKHRSAARSREKLDIHRELWRSESLREAERAAEVDLEDFRVRKTNLGC